MGKKRREKKIVTISGFNIIINDENNKVSDQIKKIIRLQTN